MRKTVRDLNVAEDRAYLLKRGFVWAVIYPHGERRGKVISAHKRREIRLEVFRQRQSGRGQDS